MSGLLPTTTNYYKEYRVGDLTKNLSRYEFACKCDHRCSGKQVADFELVNLIQGAADYFGSEYRCAVRVNITSGNRCRAHNEAIPGAAKHSMHTQYIAADFNIELLIGDNWRLLPQQELADYLHEQLDGHGGIKIYSNRVHLDTRKGYWREGFNTTRGEM